MQSTVAFVFLSYFLTFIKPNALWKCEVIQARNNPTSTVVFLTSAMRSAGDWAPPAEEYRQRQDLLRGIETYIRYHGFPAARLTLFGSSCNGFGFRNSDLDICMTFDGCDDPQVGAVGTVWTGHLCTDRLRGLRCTAAESQDRGRQIFISG